MRNIQTKKKKTGQGATRTDREVFATSPTASGEEGEAPTGRSDPTRLCDGKNAGDKEAELSTRLAPR
jgi:hypothetical protein